MSYKWGNLKAGQVSLFDPSLDSLSYPNFGIELRLLKPVGGIACPEPVEGPLYWKAPVD